MNTTTEQQRSEALAFIRERIEEAPTDDALLEKLIALGDAIRAEMSPDIEVDYTETQMLAIACSAHYEIALDKETDDFDFEADEKDFDRFLQDSDTEQE